MAGRKREGNWYKNQHSLGVHVRDDLGGFPANFRLRDIRICLEDDLYCDTNMNQLAYPGEYVQ